MISTRIDNLFDSAQQGLYKLEHRLAGARREEREQPIYSLNGGVPLLSRVAAIPVATIDLTLECLRSVMLVVEGVAYTALALIAIPLALILGVSKHDYSLARNVTRLTLLNLHNTIQNLVYAPFKIALTPLFLIGQMALIAADPRYVRPSHENIEIFEENNFSFVKTLNTLQETLYAGLNKGVRRHEPRLQRSSRQTKNSSKVPFGSRVKVIALACLDPFLDILKPLVKIIAAVVAIPLGLVGFAIGCTVALFSGTKAYERNRRVQDGIRGILSQFNTLAFSIAEVVTKTVMAPFTLIGQIVAGEWDPENVKTSAEQLYSPHAGGSIRSSKGIIRNQYDNDMSLL